MEEKSGYVKVSIMIPVYNARQYLKECLESVLNQTFREIEVIAVDDCSQDGSFQILIEYSKKDSRLRVYRNERNRGVSHTLNQALKYCTASIVARVDSDDVMYRDRIEKQYAYLQENPDCIVLGGQVTYINDRGQIIGNTMFPLSDKKIKSSFFYYQPIADPTLMIHRNRIPNGHLYFDETLPIAEGLDLYFRLFKFGKFSNLSVPVVLYRQRKDSLRNKNLKRTFSYISEVRLRAEKKYGMKAPFAAKGVALLQKVMTSILPFSTAAWLFDTIKKLLVKEKGCCNHEG